MEKKTRVFEELREPYPILYKPRGVEMFAEFEEWHCCRPSRPRRLAYEGSSFREPAELEMS